jgi:hypothetical protein
MNLLTYKLDVYQEISYWRYNRTTRMEISKIAHTLQHLYPISQLFLVISKVVSGSTGGLTVAIFASQLFLLISKP